MIFRLHLTSGGYADIDTAGIEWTADYAEQEIKTAFAAIVLGGGWITVAETGQMVNLEYVTYVEPE